MVTALACTAARWRPNNWAATFGPPARASAKAPHSLSNCPPRALPKNLMKTTDKIASNRVLVVDDNPSIHADFRKILCPAARGAADNLSGLEAELFGDSPRNEPSPLFNMASPFQEHETLPIVHAPQQQVEREINQRALIEASLRQSEERFHKAFETASVSLAIMRASDQRYLDVNQGFVELCGRDKESVLGKTPGELGLLAQPERCDEM